MDTLKVEEIKHIREHLAIPHGGRKLLFGVVATLVLMACALAGGHVISLWLIANHNADPMTPIGLIIGVAIAITILVHMVSGARLEWLKDFACKNKNGLLVHFYKNARGLISYVFCTSDEDKRIKIRPEGSTGLEISLKLGGWFTKSRIITRDVSTDYYFQGWTVRLMAVWSDTVMVELRCNSNVGDEKESVVIDIGRALDYLDIVERYGATFGRDLSGLISFLHSHCEAVQNELKEERKHSAVVKELCDQACHDRDELQRVSDSEHQMTNQAKLGVIEWSEKYIELLISTIDKIDATRRFFNSKEAQKIREDLVQLLLETLPADDPRRANYAPKD